MNILFPTKNDAADAKKLNGQTAYQDGNTFAKADWSARATGGGEVVAESRAASAGRD
jgi:hypothetical protein